MVQGYGYHWYLREYREEGRKTQSSGTGYEETADVAKMSAEQASHTH